MSVPVSPSMFAPSPIADRTEDRYRRRAKLVREALEQVASDASDAGRHGAGEAFGRLAMLASDEDLSKLGRFLAGIAL